jgi:hypothetical protein
MVILILDNRKVVMVKSNLELPEDKYGVSRF